MNINCNYLRKLVHRSFAFRQNATQIVPRTLIVLDQPNPIDGVMHFVLEHILIHSGVLQHKETLIPCGIVAHIL